MVVLDRSGGGFRPGVSERSGTERSEAEWSEAEFAHPGRNSPERSAKTTILVQTAHFRSERSETVHFPGDRFFGLK